LIIKTIEKNNESSKLLFVAHRKKFLQQKATFQGILKKIIIWGFMG
jgi:hypothetical protein